MSAEELERTGRDESLRSLTRDVNGLKEGQSSLRLVMWAMGAGLAVVAVLIVVLFMKG